MAHTRNTQIILLGFMMVVIFRDFCRSDYAWYQAWFADRDLMRALGPMDQTWLDAVLGDEDGSQFVAIVDGQISGVLGVTWVVRTIHFTF